GKKRKNIVVAGENNNFAVDAVLQSREMGFGDPVFCGKEFSGLKTKETILFDNSDANHALEKAVGMVNDGKADILLNTNPLTPEFLDFAAGMNNSNSRVVNYINIFASPKEQRLTLFTDTLINPNPGIKEKIGIVNNSIPVADVLGIKNPNIAALAPVEFVNPAIRSTMDAAILSKMSQRGQFGKSVVEGPLAMDNAESAIAARQKGVESIVPGNVDIYLFPDIESANITAQFLSFVFQVKLCGILTGTGIPMVVQSSLEQNDSWIYNIALAVLMG
ncbi:MAG: phosphate acyltransferase, partial [Thermodesulfobacteriota bacterium]|nr:phosphate acyltransferase [Thermodesulfobacteriota bacterium]